MVEIKEKVRVIKEKTDSLCYRTAMKEVELYFSNFYLFGKSADKILSFGSLAEYAFIKLFESRSKIIVLSIIFNISLFLLLSIFSSFWQSSFIFSLFVFGVSLLIINNEKESLYRKFMKNEKIKIKTSQGVQWINKDDIAQQMIEENRW